MRKIVLFVVFALLLFSNQQASAEFGDGEVCLPLDYLGRIQTGGGFAVGDVVSGDGFSITVTSVKDGGEITGFTITSGSYTSIVIHAGGGSETFSDPTGPFEHGLSFVAFCGETVDPTETPTDVPTETPTEIPTETPTEVPTETPTPVVVTDCKDPETGEFIECPTATPDVPTATPTVPIPTATVDDGPRVTQFPDTGSGDIHGESKTTVFVLGSIALVALSVWYSLTTGRRRR